MLRFGPIVAAAFALCVISCTSKDKSTSGKVEIQDIAVEVDGTAGEAITAARLAGLKPDYTDGNKRAWKLTRLLPKALAGEGRVVEVSGAGKARLKLRNAGEVVNGTVVALVVGVGEPFVARIDPAKPFATPTMRSVARIAQLRVYAPSQGKRRKPPVKADKLEVKIQLDGKAHATWKIDELNKVPTIEGKPRHWSMRAIADHIAKGARISEVVSRKGNTQKLDAERWADERLKPLIKLNRRGMLKFWWNRDGKRFQQVRDVVVIRAVTR